MTLVPGCFYMFVVSSYLLNAKIGFGLEWTVAYFVAGVLTAAYCVLVVRAGLKRRQRIESGVLDPKEFDTPDDTAEKGTKAPAPTAVPDLEQVAGRAE